MEEKNSEKKERKMRDFGIPWIGEVPEGWECSRIGGFYSPRMIKVSDVNYQPLSVTMKGIVPQLETAAKTNDHNNRKLVKKGDFAINSRSDRRGSCGISKYDGSVSLINTVLSPNVEMCPQFFDWLFHTTQFSDEFYKWGHGIVDDLWTTGWQDMKKINIPVPPIPEQYRIADFLDSKCSEIDALIENLRARVESTKEYKKVVITEAVTKGMDKDAKMKDSGIEWIGEIPEKWSNSRIKYVIIPLQRPVKNNDLIVTCFRDGTVTTRQNRREEGFTISLTENGYQGVNVGDLVIHGMDAFAGAIGCSDSRGKITPVVHVCKTMGNNRFFMFLLRSMAMNDVLMSYSDGVRIRSSDYRNFNKLGKFSIAVPPVDEQNQIADYLDSKCSEIDALLQNYEDQIATLEEYKKSLIYEYVTGKKEVPTV